jgi:hypothetical protein
MAEDFSQTPLGDLCDEARDRRCQEWIVAPAGVLKHTLARFADEAAGRFFVEDAETGRDGGFEGKRDSTLWQKLWMVWILSPPGVSRAWAKRRRAFGRSLSPCASPQISSSFCVSALSGSIASSPSWRKSLVCISAAAAFV